MALRPLCAWTRPRHVPDRRSPADSGVILTTLREPLVGPGWRAAGMCGALDYSMLDEPPDCARHAIVEPSPGSGGLSGALGRVRRRQIWCAAASRGTGFGN